MRKTPNNVRGFVAVNLLVQRAIGKVKEKARARDRVRAWNFDHPSRKKAADAEHYKNNKNKKIKDATQWNKVNAAARRVRMRSWFKAYIEKNEMETPGFKLRLTLRNRLRCALKRIGEARNITQKQKELLQDEDRLRARIEETWTEGCHIDHIFPMSLYDLSDKSNLNRCCSFSNLKAMKASDNLSKGSHLPTKAMANKVAAGGDCRHAPRHLSRMGDSAPQRGVKKTRLAMMTPGD
jgi:hypothetical protein